MLRVREAPDPNDLKVSHPRRPTYPVAPEGATRGGSKASDLARSVSAGRPGRLRQRNDGREDFAVVRPLPMGESQRCRLCVGRRSAEADGTHLSCRSAKTGREDGLLAPYRSEVGSSTLPARRSFRRRVSPSASMALKKERQRSRSEGGARWKRH